MRQNNEKATQNTNTEPINQESQVYMNMERLVDKFNDIIPDCFIVQAKEIILEAREKILYNASEEEEYENLMLTRILLPIVRRFPELHEEMYYRLDAYPRLQRRFVALTI